MKMNNMLTRTDNTEHTLAVIERKINVQSKVLKVCGHPYILAEHLILDLVPLLL